ncbi:hypothetical protein [Mycobacterium sp.]|nr:hypothetical protein [Mycobacterium sp.]
MTDTPDDENVVKHAAGEANLRGAPVPILGGRPEDLTEHADGAFEVLVVR